MTTTTPTVPAFASLREKIRWEKQQRATLHAQFADDWKAAAAAGCAAVAAFTPTTMVVRDHDGREWKVDSGPCGFARLEVRPRNSKFALWLLKEGIARSSDYHKCVYFSVSDYGQSMERKATWAEAAAAYLIAKGYKGISSVSTLD